MEIKKVRKVGLWVIIAATLITLFVINLTGNPQLLDAVVIVAIIVLIVWLLAMFVISLICHRH